MKKVFPDPQSPNTPNASGKSRRVAGSNVGDCECIVGDVEVVTWFAGPRLITGQLRENPRFEFKRPVPLLQEVLPVSDRGNQAYVDPGADQSRSGSRLGRLTAERWSARSPETASQNRRYRDLTRRQRRHPRL